MAAKKKTRKSSRRDFLRGRAAQQAAADAVAGALPEADDAPQADAGLLVRVSRRAMACEFEVRIPVGRFPDVADRALEALDRVDAFEDAMTYFRETSELRRINREAAYEPVEVESWMFDLIELGQTLYRETDGAFDLTACPLWEVWGFARREGAVPDDEALDEALSRVGGDLVELDRQACTVAFAREGVELNFGAIGKGYALDRCAGGLLDEGIDSFLMHGGQSSVIARGARSETAADEPLGEAWTVNVVHPLRPNRRLAVVRLRDQALATSGCQVQSFVHQGRRLSHILDPRTGQPAEGVLSASAIAPTAALADALSTAFFVMGVEGAERYCRDHSEVGALLACPSRGSGGVEMHPIGLDEADFRLT